MTSLSRFTHIAKKSLTRVFLYYSYDLCVCAKKADHHILKHFGLDSSKIRIHNTLQSTMYYVYVLYV